MESPEGLPIWDIDHPQRFDHALDEVDRLLHNFLASVFSLGEHLEKFCERLVPRDSSLAAEFRERDPFPASPLVQFMERLRNITQHQRLPVAQGSLRAWRDNENRLVGEHSLVLNRWALRQHSWKDGARAYMEGLTEDPKLRPLVSEYAAVIGSFADWFGGAYVRANLEHFDGFFQLHERLGPANALFREPWV